MPPGSPSVRPGSDEEVTSGAGRNGLRHRFLSPKGERALPYPDPSCADGVTSVLEMMEKAS